MGVSRTVHVGTYLVCHMALVDKTERVDQCSKNKKHPVTGRDKFCSTCGNPVKRVDQVTKEYMSMHDIVRGEVIVPEVDAAFLSDFEPLIGEFIGAHRAGVEIVSFDMTTVDADNEGIHKIDALTTGFKQPTEKQIVELMRIVGYKDVKIERGILIDIA